MKDLDIQSETLVDKGGRLSETAETFITNDASLSGCGSGQVSTAAEESERAATMLVFYFAEQTYEAGESIENIAQVFTQQDRRFANAV